MKKLKIIFFGFLLLLLVAVEFLLGFVVAIADHISDATTAIQTKFNAAIGTTENKGATK